MCRLRTLSSSSRVKAPVKSVVLHFLDYSNTALLLGMMTWAYALSVLQYVRRSRHRSLTLRNCTETLRSFQGGRHPPKIVPYRLRRAVGKSWDKRVVVPCCQEVYPSWCEVFKPSI